MSNRLYTGAVAGKRIWSEADDLKLAKLINEGGWGQAVSAHFPKRTHAAVTQRRMVLRRRKKIL